MAGCLVFLDDAAVCHSVNHRDGRIIGGAGVVGVTRVGCSDNLLNLGANQRPQARIVRATLVVLARPLSSWGELATVVLHRV